MMDIQLKTKPVHTHDCDRCVYLGTISPRSASDSEGQWIDCYWCENKEHPQLSSMLGRYGSNGPEYASSHPPEAFASKDDYLLFADRWYLFSLLRATWLGLYKKVK